VQRIGLSFFIALALEDYDEGNALAGDDPDIPHTRQAKSGRSDGDGRILAPPPDREPSPARSVGGGQLLRAGDGSRSAIIGRSQSLVAVSRCARRGQNATRL